MTNTGGARHVRLDRILMPTPVPAGMDLATLGGLVALMRKTNEHPPPITLARTHHCKPRLYQIVDGRHRYFAAHAAGRTRILATITSVPCHGTLDHHGL